MLLESGQPAKKEKPAPLSPGTKVLLENQISQPLPYPLEEMYKEPGPFLPAYVREGILNMQVIVQGAEAETSTEEVSSEEKEPPENDPAWYGGNFDLSRSPFDESPIR